MRIKEKCFREKSWAFDRGSIGIVARAWKSCGAEKVGGRS